MEPNVYGREQVFLDECGATVAGVGLGLPVGLVYMTEINTLAFLANVNSRSVHVRYMSSSVRLSVVCLSVTFVHATQEIQIFGNVSTPFNTFVI